MVMDISAIGTNYATYIFGSEALAAFGLLFLIALIGIRFNWSLDTYIVILTPVFVSFATLAVVPSAKIAYVIVIGLLLGFGLLAVFRR